MRLEKYDVLPHCIPAMDRVSLISKLRRPFLKEIVLGQGRIALDVLRDQLRNSGGSLDFSPFSIGLNLGAGAGANGATQREILDFLCKGKRYFLAHGIPPASMPYANRTQYGP